MRYLSVETWITSCTAAWRSPPALQQRPEGEREVGVAFLVVVDEGPEPAPHELLQLGGPVDLEQQGVDPHLVEAGHGPGDLAQLEDLGRPPGPLAVPGVLLRAGTRRAHPDGDP